MAGTSVLINQGTQTAIANDSVGGTMYQTIKLDMGTTGVSNPFAGTILNVNQIGTLPNIPGGTIHVADNLFTPHVSQNHGSRVGRGRFAAVSCPRRRRGDDRHRLCRPARRFRLESGACRGRQGAQRGLGRQGGRRRERARDRRLRKNHGIDDQHRRREPDFRNVVRLF